MPITRDSAAARIDLRDLVRARALPERKLGAGETLFFKGDSAGGMYVVVSGRIDVLIFGRLLDQVGPGGIIGEMALVDCTHRSAAALAQTDATVVALDRPQFLALIAEEPRVALAVMRIMSERLARLSRITESA